MILIVGALSLCFLIDLGGSLSQVIDQTKKSYFMSQEDPSCPTDFMEYYLDLSHGHCLPLRGDHRHIRSFQNPKSLCFLAQLMGVEGPIYVSQELTIRCF